MWWIWACVGEPSDRELYLRAKQEPENAVEICAAITNSDEQGECLLFAATEGNHGSEACHYARMERWKEACFFEVIDTKGVPKYQAKDSCARTGRFLNRCVYHIIQREEQSLMHRFPIGQETAMSQYIQTEIQQLGGEELRNDPLSQTLVSRIIARRFLKQWRKDNKLLFPSKFCGTASEDICMKGYRFVIRLGNQLPKPCKVPSSQSLSTELRLPYWEDAFQAKAFRVWSEICRNSH